MKNKILKWVYNGVVMIIFGCGMAGGIAFMIMLLTGALGDYVRSEAGKDFYFEGNKEVTEFPFDGTVYVKATDNTLEIILEQK